MAKKVWDKPIDKNIPWDGNQNTDNLPVCGYRIEEFLKEELASRIGILHYDTTNNRYLAFADTSDRDEYLENPTKVELILATFDAPFNYSAEINLQTSSYNAVFLNSIGNYIRFTFDIKNKQGQSTGESTIVKYTIIRGSNKQEITEIKPAGTQVSINVDKYLLEGTNTIIVSITGRTTLTATSIAITYEVINLSIEDELNISNVYNLTNGTAELNIAYSISGYGTKIVEWYIDGVLQPFIKSEDEIVESSTSKIKGIQLKELSQGRHSLQFRAYTTVNGQRFYTDTLYRDLLVYTGISSDIIIGIATKIPVKYGIIEDNNDISIYDIVQYIPYNLRFATYTSSNISNIEVNVFLDNELKATVQSNNNIENVVTLTSKTSGDKKLKIIVEDIEYSITAKVSETSLNIREITSDLSLSFDASGKTNNSPDKDTWTDGVYTGTLKGFDWNNTSGWVDNRLEISNGASFEINYKPLAGNVVSTGKTIEIEWSTKNVTNDNAVICDLREEGIGIVIYATKVVMVSEGGTLISTEYKSDENVRIAFVINRNIGAVNPRLSFIYTNGIISRAINWADTDNYTSNANIKFVGSSEATVSLKSIRVYDAVLSSDNVLNNFILYRDTISEMLEVYDRNDIYEDGRDVFSIEKMASRLPVMVVTGDIPTLENTTDKNETIIVDIEYTNMQDPSKSFRLSNAVMKPQGTSSMGYPKKNFRIYTRENENTILYNSEGDIVEDRLYSFKDNAQPVDCWCLKADYAESSGTHNTGIARMWNKALFDTQIDGEYKLRTNAQKAALANNYKYDVRTTIDGFPILMFYRPSINDDLIFIGKYNFNNDKSTESVFGFVDVPGFNNSRMQCWEVLNNGNPLALFTSIDDFDNKWSEAFESRYPDTKNPNISDLKAFSTWLYNCKEEDFKTEKWEHMDIYKMAAYWVYLMRFAGADQFVKNAMFTSEDGIHFYYILYDNDTINGLINTGHLEIGPADNRQTKNAADEYVFAGHDSKLWNLLEADKEFIDIVSLVDNQLYQRGISYDNAIKTFDEDQADKWVEKVYNQDAQYKYINPFVDKGINNLFMLQGKRDLHRKWWLAKRFSIYDAKYVSGKYKSLSVEIKCLNDTPAGQQFSITAGYPLDYGYGINNLPREFGIPLEVGETKEFTTVEVVNRGDPIRIYGAPHISKIDFSKMADKLSVVTINNVYEESLRTKLTDLIIGNPLTENTVVSEISGLKQAVNLEYLDIRGMKGIISLDLSNHSSFRVLKAHNTNITSVSLTKGAPVSILELPSSIRSLVLNQLPILSTDGLILEDIKNVQSINISSCPNLSNDFSFVYNWYINKIHSNSSCLFTMDNIRWDNVDTNEFLNFINLKTEDNIFSLKGKINIPNASIETIYAIRDTFGETVFFPNAELYIEVPPVVELKSDVSKILEGENIQFDYELYPVFEGEVIYSIVEGREGVFIDLNTGLLTSTETAEDTSDIIVRVTFNSSDGETSIYADKVITVERRTYPSNITISGSGDLLSNTVFEVVYGNTGINGSYRIEWVLNGNIKSYYSIRSNNRIECVLDKTKAIPDTTNGTLIVNIIREFDNTTVSTNTIQVSHTVTWMQDATIIGNANPLETPMEYTWATTTQGVNGDYYAEWTLSGDVTSVVGIKSQTNAKCTLKALSGTTEIVSGILTLQLKKQYDDSVIVSASKTLAALMEGVVITSTTNAGVQAALYNAGLVANETFSLKEEVEKITADQLQPKTSYGSSIFYNYRSNITHFDEFKHFTSVNTIKSATFYECYSLTSITIPDSVTSIGDYAFYYCTSLKSVTIPNSVTSIGFNAFAYCDSLTSITIGNSVTSIGRAAFWSCKSLKSVNIPDNVTSIGYQAFSNCTSLTSVTIGNSVTTIGGSAFYNCRSLTSIAIPDSVTSINSSAFIGCTSLTSATIGNGVTSIGDEAFSICPSLKTIVCKSTQAPTCYSISFGNGESSYAGRNTYNTGENMLYVPVGATGYDASYWLDPLQNSSKCGFTLSATL